MPAPSSVAPLAGLLADLAADLRRGDCCLVVCDKGWVLPLYANLRERLRAAGVKCGYLDGRPTADAPTEMGTMLTAVAQMRWGARAEDLEGVVFALPHLDVMTACEGGWNSISREVVPILYENPASLWLGFQDPSLPLLPVVEKLFGKRHVVTQQYRPTDNISTTEPVQPLQPTPVGAPEPDATGANPPAEETVPEAKPDE